MATIGELELLISANDQKVNEVLSRLEKRLDAMGKNPTRIPAPDTSAAETKLNQFRDILQRTFGGDLKGGVLGLNQALGGGPGGLGGTLGQVALGFGAATAAIGVFSVALQGVRSLIGGISAQFSEMARKAGEFNAQILGAAAAQSAAQRVYVNGREVTDPRAKIEALRGRVTSDYRQLDRLAQEIPNLSENDLYQMYGTISRNGPFVKNPTRLAGAIASGFATYNIPAWQQEQEVRSLLTGDLGSPQDSRLATNLGLKGSEIRSALTAGKLEDLLLKKLEPAMAGAGLAAGSLANAQSNFGSIISRILRDAGKPLEVEFASVFQRMTKVIADNEPAITQALNRISNALIGLIEGSIRVAKFLGDAAKDFDALSKGFVQIFSGQFVTDFLRPDLKNREAANAQKPAAAKEKVTTDPINVAPAVQNRLVALAQEYDSQQKIQEKQLKLISDNRKAALEVQQKAQQAILEQLQNQLRIQQEIFGVEKMRGRLAEAILQDRVGMAATPEQRAIEQGRVLDQQAINRQRDYRQQLDLMGKEEEISRQNLEVQKVGIDLKREELVLQDKLAGLKLSQLLTDRSALEAKGKQGSDDYKNVTRAIEEQNLIQDSIRKRVGLLGTEQQLLEQGLITTQQINKYKREQLGIEQQIGKEQDSFTRAQEKLAEVERKTAQIREQNLAVIEKSKNALNQQLEQQSRQLAAIRRQNELADSQDNLASVRRNNEIQRLERIEQLQRTLKTGNSAERAGAEAELKVLGTTNSIKDTQERIYRLKLEAIDAEEKAQMRQLRQKQAELDIQQKIAQLQVATSYASTRASLVNAEATAAQTYGQAARNNQLDPSETNRKLMSEANEALDSIRAALKDLDATFKPLAQAVGGGLPGLRKNDAIEKTPLKDLVVRPTTATIQLSGSRVVADAARGGGGLVELLHGVKGMKGYDADHGVGNDHVHAAFATTDQAKAAASFLKQQGFPITEFGGWGQRVGGHAPNSYHYSNQAFDIPVPVGQHKKVIEAIQFFVSTGDALAKSQGSGFRTARASWYGPGFHGRKTANGETFDQDEFTFAHKSLPFGTRVEFRNGDRSAVGRVNDRGPHIAGREFDLSKGLADALGITGKGVADLQVKVLDSNTASTDKNTEALQNLTTTISKPGTETTDPNTISNSITGTKLTVDQAKAQGKALQGQLSEGADMFANSKAINANQIEALQEDTAQRKLMLSGENANNQMSQQAEELNQIKDRLGDVFDTFSSGLKGALEDTENFGESMKQTFASMLKQMGNELIDVFMARLKDAWKRLINQIVDALNNLFSGGGGGGGGGFTNVLGSIGSALFGGGGNASSFLGSAGGFGGITIGNAFQGALSTFTGAQPRPFADGGIVGRFGEAGPEAIVPMKQLMQRYRSGRTQSGAAVAALQEGLGDGASTSIPSSYTPQMPGQGAVSRAVNLSLNIESTRFVGEDWVTVDQFQESIQAVLAAAQQQTEDSMRSPIYRGRWGL